MHETIYTLPSCPVSIALLSDLHNRPFDPVIASLQKQSPDLICITGDVLYGSQPEGYELVVETQENVLPFLSACAAIAPTFLSLGNHEWMLSAEDIETLAATGVTVLDNEWKSVEINGKRLIIGGLSSGYVTEYRRFVAELYVERTCRYPRKDDLSGIAGARTATQHKPDTSWLSDFAAQRGYRILMSHHPEYWPTIAPHPIDLVLSGHAHGGQWRIFNQGVWAPGQGLWARWTKGVYEDGRLVVSTGLSNTTWVPRLFNPTEIVFLEP